jgi:hypothetical protein
MDRSRLGGELNTYWQSSMCVIASDAKATVKKMAAPWFGAWK